MHPESYDRMKFYLDTYLTGRKREELLVLDYGSHDRNGTYRDLIKFPWRYVGADIEPGPNVDVVVLPDGSMPVQSNLYHAVLCGQVLEHVRNPFRVMQEIARVAAPQGWVFAVAPAVWRVHRYPVDTFRYNPDGMIALFEEAGLVPIEAKVYPIDEGKSDCWGIAQKPKQRG